MKTVFSVSIDVKLKELIEQECRKSGISISAFVSRILAEKLNEKGELEKAGKKPYVTNEEEIVIGGTSEEFF